MGNYVLTLRHKRCPDGAEFAPHPWITGATFRLPAKQLKTKRMPGDMDWPVIRYRSERREEYQRRLETPDELIVTEFLNTPPWVDDDSEEFYTNAEEWVADYSLMLKFISDYGFPVETYDFDKLKQEVKQKPELLRRMKSMVGGTHATVQIPGATIKPKDHLSLGVLIAIRQTLDEIWEAYEAGNVTDAVELFRDHPVRGLITGISPDFEFRNGKPTLSLPINSPYGFMLMETALVITGGSQVTRCSQCGTILVTGSGTGRRGTARYCSNRCRVAAQRSRKVEDVMTDEEKLQNIAAAVRGTVTE
jgi:hypothetical protein